MTVKEEMREAVKSGDSNALHDAVARWLAGTISTDELTRETVGTTVNSPQRENHNTAKESGE